MARAHIKLKYMTTSLLIVGCILSMGCLDMELMDGMLPYSKEESSGYHLIQKKSVYYSFNTSVGGAPSQFYKTMGGQEFRVVDSTRWLKITISVNLDKNNLVQDLLEALGINKTLTRYVKVTLTDSNSTVVYKRDFYETTTIEPIVLQSPVSGIWKLDISAKGVGGEIQGFQVYDGFNIRVLSYEPI